MAFIADNEALRTYDPERGVELKKVGGGSDGGMYFIFHPIGRPEEALGGFWTHGEGREATPMEQSNMPGVKEIYVWVIDGAYRPGFPIRGFGREESREIIREAMLAYRGVHGAPVGSAAVIFDVRIEAGFMNH